MSKSKSNKILNGNCAFDAFLLLARRKHNISLQRAADKDAIRSVLFAALKVRSWSVVCFWLEEKQYNLLSQAHDAFESRSCKMCRNLAKSESYAFLRARSKITVRNAFPTNLKMRVFFTQTPQRPRRAAEPAPAPGLS